MPIFFLILIKFHFFFNFQVKRNYRLYDPDALTKAYIGVKENIMAIKRAARLHSVPETTLRQRVIGAVSIDTVKSGPSPLFSCEQEARLVDHVILMAKVGYGYTRPDLCNLATAYAVDLGLREKDQPLSLQWYRNFITRWPNLVVKKPRTLAIARAKAASEENVTAYFQQLDTILTKNNLKEKPQHV